MREHPLLMKGPLVRATLEGRKTQTRRIVKPQPIGLPWFWEGDEVDPEPQWFDAYERGREPCGAATEEVTTPMRCPYGQPGDRLWVRETWDWRDWQSGQDGKIRIAYAADGEQVDRIAPPDWNPTIYNAERWRPSIHMPRWACRLVLPLVSMRVERVQEITEEDAKAEGLRRTENGWTDGASGYDVTSARMAFQELWASIYGEASWDANPWVWVAEWDHVEVRK